MKCRAITFAFAACLVSSMAFADSPTDAPLLPYEEKPAVAPLQNCVNHSPRNARKKDESRPPNAKNQRSTKNDLHAEQLNPEYPVAAKQ
jgi:hypothetical protein